MEMVNISKTDYDEFLAWKNGGNVNHDSAKKPAGGWNHYNPAVNPFAKTSLNLIAQNEVVTHDLDLAIRLAESAGSGMVDTLRSMKQREVLRSNGF